MKKGFTLVELLGVIVVLSIILVIAVPRILDVIDNSQKQKFLNDVREITEIAKLHYEKEGEDFVTIDFSGQGTETTETGEEKPLDFILDFEGEMPISGIIYFTDNQNNETIDMTKIDVVLENVTSSNGKWCANKNYGEDIVVTRCEE